MGLGSTITRGLSIAGSSNYEPSHRTSSASTRSTVYPPTVTSRSSKPSTVRDSSFSCATSMSKLIRSASTSRESTSASMTSTVRPPTVASRSSKASISRASTVTSATSTSKLIRSASTASTARPPTSTPATSTTSLSRSPSKRGAPSYFSTAANRILWGRPPPGHSTLQPSQIATLTHTLSFPADSPMLSSVVGALPVPLSRSQFSPMPTCFCNAHFWFEQRYIDELTEVIAHEIGPQLDKLRTAPAEFISKKTQRLLSILEPYKDIFTLIRSETSSIVSMKPACPACTLSHFFQNPHAVSALATCAKGRKHRAHPWPTSMAWLEPCPGKGVDWEAKWKTEGKSIGRDRSRLQRWRRNNRLQEQVPEQPQLPGHQPGEGCDFCDSLRMEQADEAELDAAIAEEGEDEERAVESLSSGALSATDHNDSETLYDSASETYRAMKEESIIDAYAPSTKTYPPSQDFRARVETDVYCPSSQNDHNKNDWTKEEEAKETKKQARMGHLATMGGNKDEERTERAKRASDWARSYQHLVGRRPDLQTTLQFERYPEASVGGAESRAVDGWF